MDENEFLQLLNEAIAQDVEYFDFIDGIVSILSRLDDNSLDDVIRSLKCEQYKRRDSRRVQHRQVIKESCTCEIPDSFVAIDFETLYAQRVSACSIGMVKYRQGEIVEKYYSLIRPPFEYQGKCGPALTWVHGFTEDMFENELTFEELLPDIESFIEGLPLVAHNACVEKACFLENMDYYGIHSSIDLDNFIDTFPISLNVERQLGIFVKGPGTHTLDALCRRFQVNELSHHNALDDAEMCGNLLLKFSECLQGKFQLNIDPVVKTVSKEKYRPEDKIQRTDLENVVDNPFKDCGVVLTGFSNEISQEYGHILKELGAKVCTGVSGKTRWLICGANAGPSKIEKATEIGARIINEEDFLKMIEK